MGMTYSSKSATFNPTRTHRHSLERCWDKNKDTIVVVGVNPSSANEEDPDPTINKVVGFASRWGYGAIQMLNLYTLVATYPVDLKRAIREKGERYAIGEVADHILVKAFSKHEAVWFAWGVNAFPARANAVGALALACNRTPVCIGLNKDGSPLHPLMASYKLARMPYVTAP